VNITNVHIYNKTVINNNFENRVSYNSGRRGINARPGRFEETAAHERHFEATGMQVQHERSAGSNREFLASVNHGRPSVAATMRPGEFGGREVTSAGANRPGNRSFENRASENRASENRGRGNRSFENRPSENRSVPRPANSERGMQRNDSYANNRGGQGHNRAPEVRDRGNAGPRASAPRQENARPHENAPRGEGDSRSGNGHEDRPHL
jgi:hypothetical protein